MTHKTTITDNYILITSDEEIKEGDYNVPSDFWDVSITSKEDLEVVNNKTNGYLKVIAHLPLNNATKLEGVPLLPPLPSGEDDVDKMAEQHQKGGYDWQNEKRKSFKEGYNKAREKYRFTEEDMKKAIVMATTSKYDHKLEFHSQEEIIQSLSQPKMPTHFKAEMKRVLFDPTTPYPYDSDEPKIINGVMQGEWIY